MKFAAAALFTALVTLAVAAPVDVELERRQALDTSNDFVNGGCKDIVMLYARASTEPGNIGLSVGPELKSQIASAVGSGRFAMQGLDYPAALADNFLPRGSTPSAIADIAALITRVANQCPNAKIVAGGYSQGTAVVARAIEDLNSAIRSRINAVVLFGYTQNTQLNRGVPGMPANKVKIYCAAGDLVCTGTLIITAAEEGKVHHPSWKRDGVTIFGCCYIR